MSRGLSGGRRWNSGLGRQREAGVRAEEAATTEAQRGQLEHPMLVRHPRSGEQEAGSEPLDSHVRWAGGAEAVGNGRAGTKPREQRVMNAVQCYDSVKEDEDGRGSSHDQEL